KSLGVPHPILGEAGAGRKRPALEEILRCSAQHIRRDNIQLAAVHEWISNEDWRATRINSRLPQGRRVINLILENRPAQSISPDLGAQRFAKVSCAHARCGYSRDLASGGASIAVKIHICKEKSLIPTVVNLRNHHRAADGKSPFVLNVFADRGRQSVASFERAVSRVKV